MCPPGSRTVLSFLLRVYNVTRFYIESLYNVTRLYIHTLCNVTRLYIESLYNDTRVYIESLYNVTRLYIESLCNVTRLLESPLSSPRRFSTETATNADQLSLCICRYWRESFPLEFLKIKINKTPPMFVLPNKTSTMSMRSIEKFREIFH